MVCTIHECDTYPYIHGYMHRRPILHLDKRNMHFTLVTHPLQHPTSNRPSRFFRDARKTNPALLASQTPPLLFVITVRSYYSVLVLPNWVLYMCIAWLLRVALNEAEKGPGAARRARVCSDFTAGLGEGKNYHLENNFCRGGLHGLVSKWSIDMQEFTHFETRFH